MDPELIIQSDAPKSKSLVTGVPAWIKNVFESKIGDKQYLMLPKSGGSPAQDITIEVDGRKLLAFPFPLAQNPGAEYLPVYDLTAHSGKILRLHYNSLENSRTNELVKLGNDMPMPPKDGPAFHIRGINGGLNDPNGLVYYDGEYHHFHQFRFCGLRSVFWYHLVSTNLVDWRSLPLAIFPDNTGAMFSGSAVVDWFNTSGFQSGKEKVIVAAGTGSKGTGGKWLSQTQSISYSNDRGRTFTKYAGNPVLSEERALRVNPIQNSVFDLEIAMMASMFNSL